MNVDALNKEGDYYLEAALKEYDTKTPIVGTYIGLLDVGMDGAIQQVSYAIHEGGCDTVIARDTEELHRVQPYRQRRALEKQRADASKAADEAARIRHINAFGAS